MRRRVAASRQVSASVSVAVLANTHAHISVERLIGLFRKKRMVCETSASRGQACPDEALLDRHLSRFTSATASDCASACCARVRRRHRFALLRYAEKIYGAKAFALTSCFSSESSAVCFRTWSLATISSLMMSCMQLAHLAQRYASLPSSKRHGGSQRVKEDHVQIVTSVNPCRILDGEEISDVGNRICSRELPWRSVCQFSHMPLPLFPFVLVWFGHPFTLACTCLAGAMHERRRFAHLIRWWQEWTLSRPHGIAKRPRPTDLSSGSRYGLPGFVPQGFTPFRALARSEARAN